jgi:hypothetical protein
VCGRNADKYSDGYRNPDQYADQFRDAYRNGDRYSGNVNTVQLGNLYRG